MHEFISGLFILFYWYVKCLGESFNFRWRDSGNSKSYCCSVLQSCPALCNLMDCSMLGFPIFHYIPEFAQTHVHWVDDTIQPSYPLSLPFPVALNLSQHQGLFPVTQLFTSGDQYIGTSASASVLPMNIQSWFPLGLTSLISLQESSPAPQFKSISSLVQPSLWSNSHIST